MKLSISNAVLDAWAVIMPVSCVGCGREGRTLCPTCRSHLLSDERLIHVQKLTDGTPVISALAYQGTVRDAVLGYKNHGRTDATRALAESLSVAIAHALGYEAPGSMPIELIAIPSSRAAYRRRGYDPVGRLVRWSGYRTARGLFQTVKPHAEQKLLSGTERQTNMVGSFSIRRPLTGCRFVLIDDVITTGSTLLEAARVIRLAGGSVVAAATLAFTPLRGS